MSDTKHEPGVNLRTKKLDGRMFRYNDSIFSVSAFGNFLCFDLLDSCPQKKEQLLYLWNIWNRQLQLLETGDKQNHLRSL